MYEVYESCNYHKLICSQSEPDGLTVTVKFFESDPVDQSTRNLPDSTKPKL